MPQLLVLVNVIIAAPEATPVTAPVDELTVAVELLLLVQTPPEAVSVSDIELLTQTLDGPEIAEAIGTLLTLTVYNALAVPHEFVTV